jgi:G3E family GTPase
VAKIDLITGFLGSGKTTFLKKYVNYLLSKGQKVGIIENDYGAVNIDMMLLGGLMDRGVEVETIAGACDYDCHKRRFKTKLIAMGMQNFDRVIVEPSGIFDVDEFFDTLHEEPLDRWFEIGSVIAIIDAVSDDELSEESGYLTASQAANAGALIFSKTQLSDEHRIKNKIAQINSALKSINCGRDISDIVIKKNWDDFTNEDFNAIENCGYEVGDYTKNILSENGYMSLYFMNTNLSPENAETLAEKLLKTYKYGKVFRVKGFIKDGENWFELNATKKQTELKPIKNGQDIIIAIGENLDEEKLKKAVEDEA